MRKRGNSCATVYLQQCLLKFLALTEKSMHICTSLLCNVTNYDGTSQLQHVLQKMPRNFENFITHTHAQMLHNIHKIELYIIHGKSGCNKSLVVTKLQLHDVEKVECVMH